MSKRAAYPRTLEKKLTHWKRALKLDGWKITIRYATKTDNDKGDINLEKDLACVATCSPPEQIAAILINKDYATHRSNTLVWNIDTIILHELIHILMWAYTKGLPDKVYNSRKFHELEEFVCDSVARLLFDLTHRPRKT